MRGIFLGDRWIRLRCRGLEVVFEFAFEDVRDVWPGDGIAFVVVSRLLKRPVQRIKRNAVIRQSWSARRLALS
ncbi:MAG: hypothetical protein ACNA8W_04335 [Bradymonadaceae bacterium]